MRQFLLVLGSAFVLAACGSSGGGGGGGGQSGPTGVKAEDPFISAVQQLSASSPENADPASVEAVPVTAPEDAEPVEAG